MRFIFPVLIFSQSQDVCSLHCSQQVAALCVFWQWQLTRGLVLLAYSSLNSSAHHSLWPSRPIAPAKCQCRSLISSCSSVARFTADFMCPTFCRSHVIELYPVIAEFTVGRTCQPILIVCVGKTGGFLAVSISQMRRRGSWKLQAAALFACGCNCVESAALLVLCSTSPLLPLLLLLLGLILPPGPAFFLKINIALEC